MQSSPIPVRARLYAMYKVGVARKGLSGLQISRGIGVTQKTAGFMLRRIRQTCGGHGWIVRGIVEINKTRLASLCGGRAGETPPRRRNQFGGDERCQA